MNTIKRFSTQIIQLIAYLIVICRIDWISSKIRIISNIINSEVLRLRIKSPYHISIADHNRIIGIKHVILNGRFSALSDLRLECLSHYNGQDFTPVLEIGNEVSFGQRCHIACINHIKIGDNVLFGSNILITDHSHGQTGCSTIAPACRPLHSKGGIVIGDNSWICDNVCILPNVKIGKNCIIGAGAIVNSDIPDNSVAVGNPARIIKK